MEPSEELLQDGFVKEGVMVSKAGEVITNVVVITQFNASVIVFVYVTAHKPLPVELFAVEEATTGDGPDHV